MTTENQLSDDLTALYRKVETALPNTNVERDDYCVGYWAREAGFERPEQDEAAKGWDGRDEEIRTDSLC